MGDVYYYFYYYYYYSNCSYNFNFIVGIMLSYKPIERFMVRDIKFVLFVCFVLFLDLFPFVE